MAEKPTFSAKANRRSDDDTTGLSARVQSHNQRSIRADGSFNVEYRGLPFFGLSDLYQKLIVMAWWKFSLVVLATYFLVNTLFAFIYFFIGVDQLTNILATDKWDEFWEAFFFSAQSLTTVGYGRIAPQGMGSSSLAAFESLLGLLGFAVATGLLYGRFSKPNAKIAYSKNAIIAPYQNTTALMFRIANGRKTQLVECEVTVTIAKIENESGREVRRFYPLILERNRITLFPTSWTIVHPINSESPFYQKTLQDMSNEDMEIVVYFKGYDEVFASEVHYRISYKAEDLIWGAKFRVNFEQLPNGMTVHYLDRIHDFDRIALPTEILVES